MRYQGHNVFAILAAAVAIWLIGALIYAVLFSEIWIEWMGLTKEQIESAGTGRMAFMWVMPLLQAIGLSLIIKWRDRPGWLSGLTTGVLVAVFISIAARMYSWVYSFEVVELFGLDSAHFLLTHAVAGAILGAWK